MKKVFSIIIAILLVVSFSSCVSPTPVESPTPSQTFTPTPTPAITAMSELSEIEVSELLRQHITRDMSHEDVFSRLEALGFIKWRDVLLSNTFSSINEDVIYLMGDVTVQIFLDIEYRIDLTDDYYIDSYKSDQITVNGVRFIRVDWIEDRRPSYYEEPYVVPERVAEQRTIQAFLNENIKLGDDFITATELIEEFGFVLTEYYGADKSSRVYQYDNYTLRIRSSNRNVDYMYLVYHDILFDNRMEN